MSYLVVAYPHMAKNDLAWIDEYRKKHDQIYYKVIPPHITFVFGISSLPLKQFTAEIKKQLEGIRQIHFELRLAVINRDLSGTFYHEFLVPETGYHAIATLHDKLYSGKLAEHWRFDIDYIPHLGIGNNKSPQSVKQRVDILNKKGIFIPGIIQMVDIIEYKEGIVTTLERIPLAE